jgi:hypothetical protein
MPQHEGPGILKPSGIEHRISRAVSPYRVRSGRLMPS